MFGFLSKFTEAPSITPWANVKKALTAEEILLHNEELFAKVFLSCIYPYTGRKVGVVLFGSNTMRETIWYAARSMALFDVLGPDLRPIEQERMTDRGREYLDQVRLLSILMRTKLLSEDCQKDLARFDKAVERKLLALGIPVFQLVLNFLFTPISEDGEQALRKFEES